MRLLVLHGLNLDLPGTCRQQGCGPMTLAQIDAELAQIAADAGAAPQSA